MILSNPVKFFLLALVFVSFGAGCRFCQNAANTNSSPGGQIFTEDNNDLPFPTREPEVYQAKVVVTAGGTERISLVAKSGSRRRCEFDSGERTRLVWLSTDKEYLLLPDKKIYAEQMSGDGDGPLTPDLESMTTEWLNSRTWSEFESLGDENGLKKYRSKSSGGAASEAILFIDKSGLPLKQEFYSVNGEQRDMLYTVELRDLKMEAPDELFAVPGDYRKVPMEELRKAMKNG